MIPIERRFGLAEQVHRRVADSIVSGVLPAGTPVVFDQLAAQLGVSKTPIREAIGVLIRDGLIRNEGGGLRVAPLDAEYVREFYAVRSALESVAAEVVASRLTDEDIRELERTLHPQRYTDGPAAGPPAPELDFHDVIRAKCPWPYLNALIDNIQTHRARVRQLELSATTMNRKLVHDEHLALMGAFRSRDGKASRTLMQAHLDRMRDEIAQLAERSGVVNSGRRSSPTPSNGFPDEATRQAPR